MTTSHEEDLRADLAKGHVVCIAGTGVSLAAAGSAPARHPDPLTWTGLLQQGVSECCKLRPDDAHGAWGRRHREMIESGDLDERLSAAEHIGNKLGAPNGGDFGRWLRESFKDIPLGDRRVPAALAALGVPLLTTQYDDLLERATSHPTLTWREPAKVERALRGEEAAIVHLHGFFERPETVVLGTRSYDRLLRDASAQALQQALRALRTLIFVGAGDALADPNLRALITWSRDLFKGSETRHYLLCRTDEREALQRQHPAEERLFALAYGDSDEDLAAFLHSLAPAPRPALPPGPAAHPVTAARAAPITPFAREDLNAYLDHLIGDFGLLDLRGLSGAAQSITIPLDQVYVELQGQPDNPTERRYDRRLLDADVREHLDKLGLDGADQTVLDEQTYKVLACSGYALRVLQSGRRDLQGRPIAEAGEPVPLAEVVRRERRAIILGDPGSGKTTLLKYLGLHYARALRDGKERVLVAPPSPSSAPEEDAEEDAAEPQERAAKEGDLGPARLPIYVRIAAYAEARKKNPELAMLDFLPAYWEGQQLALASGSLRAMFEHHIAHDSALVLLDGLDEIASMRERVEIARQIETLVRTWARDPQPVQRDDRRPGWLPAPPPPPVEVGGNQVLVTSRIAGYHAAPLRDAIAHYTVQDMSNEAMDAFLRRWCLAVEQRQAGERPLVEQQRRAEAQRLALVRALEHPRIRRLAVNPLLLTLLALLNRSEGRLPRLRIELYESATRTLVETWRETGLSVEEVVDVLGPVALWIHSERPTGLVGESELRDLVAKALASWRGEDPNDLPGSFKKEVIDFIETVRRESGLLLARGEGLYGFAHLTFQEYFVARQITRKAATTKEMLHKHLADPRWREPLLLAVAQVARAVPDELEGVLRSALEVPLPHEELLHRALLFVAAALPECGRAPAAVVRQVCGEMLKEHAESRSAKRFEALRERIATTYGALRGSEAARFAEEVLCTTLAGTDSGLADSAAEIVIFGRWHTAPAVAAVVRRRGAGGYAADTGYLQLEREAGALFPVSGLPLRQAALRHPEGWAKLIEDPAMADVVWLRHTNPDGDGTGRCHAEAITRETPLSHLLSPVLSAVSPGAALRAGCLEEWRQGGALQGEAGVLLLALGESLPDLERHRPMLWSVLDDVATHLEGLFRGLWQSCGAVLTARTTSEFRARLTEFVQNLSRYGLLDGERIQELLPGSPHEALPRLLEVANSAYGFRSDRKWRKLRALLRFFPVTAALVDEAPFVSEESLSQTPAPSGAAPVARPPESLTRTRVAALVTHLESTDDQQRDAAEEGLQAGGSVSQIGPDAVVALAEHLVAADKSSDPGAGYLGTVLSGALDKIRHDDTTNLKAWLVAADSPSEDESVVAQTILTYARQMAPDVLKDLSLLLPSAGPEAQGAILEAFTLMLCSVTTDSGEPGAQPALVEAMLVSLLHSAPVELLPSCIRVCGLHALPPVAFVRTLLEWGRKDARPVVLAELAPTLGRLGPRLWAGPVRLRSEASVVEQALAAARERHAREPFHADDLAAFLFEALPPGIDGVAQSVARQLTAAPPSHALQCLERWTAGDDSGFDGTPLAGVVTLRSEIEDLLDSLADHPDPVVGRAGRAALARSLLPTATPGNADASERAAEAILASLATRILDPQLLVRALLDATNDPHARGPAHEVAAAAVALLCTGMPSAAHSLFEHLSETDEWERHEQAFAALADLGRRSPALLNEELGASLAPRLLAACFHKEDFQIRAFAITALGYLRRIGPEVGAALLASCRDVDEVRGAASVAAHRFQQFDPAVLDDLLPALTGPSASAAYAATLVLKALATGRQAIEQPSFRDRIAAALAAASTHPEASRVTLTEQYEDLSLADACYQALMEVTGS